MKRKPRSPATSVRSRRGRAGWRAWAGWALALGVGVGALLWFRGRERQAVELPDVPLAGLEPVVATQLQRAQAELRASPNSGQAWGGLALALQAHGFDREADTCFARAARLQPLDPRWPFLRAELLSTSDRGAALLLLREAARLAGRESDAPSVRLGELLLESGQLAEAEQVWQDLLRSRPNHPRALLGLAQVALARDQLPVARGWLQSAIKQPAITRSALELLATVERRSGNKPAADAAVLRARGLPPGPPLPNPWLELAASYRIGRTAWAAQGRQLLAAGRLAEAETLLSRFAQEDPQAPEVWLLQGRLRRARQDCAGAEEALRRHLSLEPNSVSGEAELGLALLCLNRPVEAGAALEKALLLKPDFAEAHFYMGLAQTRAGRVDDAVQSFHSAIRYSPNFVEPYVPLAELLIETRETAEAAQVLRRVLQLKPGDERALALLQKLGR
jgi:tetratricopeptide (TPR) repeat protein